VLKHPDDFRPETIRPRRDARRGNSSGFGNVLTMGCGKHLGSEGRISLSTAEVNAVCRREHGQPGEGSVGIRLESRGTAVGSMDREEDFARHLNRKRHCPASACGTAPDDSFRERFRTL
jgi:hypothetical protein